MAIIKASNLVKKYKNPENQSKIFNAVDGVSLSINSGEIFGILGPNGAGKTTTLEMLEGLKDIDEGFELSRLSDVLSFGLNPRTKANAPRRAQIKRNRSR